MKKSPPRANGSRKPASILFHADSGDPDMCYFSRFNTDDPYLAFTVGRKSYALSSPLEYGRMVSESAFDEILLKPEIARGAARRFKLPRQKGGNRSIPNLFRPFLPSDFSSSSLSFGYHRMRSRISNHPSGNR
jgi:hypothetical protein